MEEVENGCFKVFKKIFSSLSTGTAMLSELVLVCPERNVPLLSCLYIFHKIFKRMKKTIVRILAKKLCSTYGSRNIGKRSSIHPIKRTPLKFDRILYTCRTVGGLYSIRIHLRQLGVRMCNFSRIIKMFVRRLTRCHERRVQKTSEEICVRVLIESIQLL